jgi:hypothetical protein
VLVLVANKCCHSLANSSAIDSLIRGEKIEERERNERKGRGEGRERGEERERVEVYLG